MLKTVFSGKIHRCTVTHADLDYEGSVSVDLDLLEASGIEQFELVHVWNITTGARLQTYALEAPRGSGVICLNGAAAHRFSPGDLAIIASFVQLTPEEMNKHQPKVVLVDEHNKIKSKREEVPGPQMPPRVAD